MVWVCLFLVSNAKYDMLFPYVISRISRNMKDLVSYRQCDFQLAEKFTWFKSLSFMFVEKGKKIENSYLQVGRNSCRTGKRNSLSTRSPRISCLYIDKFVIINYIWLIKNTGATGENSCVHLHMPHSYWHDFVPTKSLPETSKRIFQTSRKIECVITVLFVTFKTLLSVCCMQIFSHK